MINCNNCHREILTPVKFCPSCGNKIDGFESENQNLDTNSITETPKEVQEDTTNDAVSEFLNKNEAKDEIKIEKTLKTLGNFEETTEFEIKDDDITQFLNKEDDAKNPTDEVAFTAQETQGDANSPTFDIKEATQAIAPTFPTPSILNEVENKDPVLDKALGVNEDSSLNTAPKPTFDTSRFSQTQTNQYHASSYSNTPNIYRGVEDEIGTWDFVVIFLLSLVPVFGQLCLFSLGFMQKSSANKRHLGRALLITQVFVVIMIFMFFLGITVSNVGSIL